VSEAIPTLADVERVHIIETLHRYGGNRTQTARSLGISIRCLRDKLHEYARRGFAIPEPQAGISRPEAVV
jgi:two-component system, response regulator FlrC